MFRLLILVLGLAFASPMSEMARADSFFVGPYGFGMSIGEPLYGGYITPYYGLVPSIPLWGVVPPPPYGFGHRPPPHHRSFRHRPPAPSPHEFGHRPPPHHRGGPGPRPSPRHR